MTFRRIQSSIVFLITIIALYIFNWYYLSLDSSIVIVVLVIAFFFFLYLVSTYYKINDDRLIRYTFLVKVFELDIASIKHIEAVTIKKAGRIYITVGKAVPEQYYFLFLRNNSKIKIDSTYKNKNGKSLGRFLISEFSIKLNEIEKTRYFYGTM